MNFKKLFFIINPASGQSLSVIPQIKKFLNTSNFEYEFRMTKKQGDAAAFAKEALQKNYNALVVYGGDGTVMEVAGSMMNTAIPLFILPGGTANILAKELKIPAYLDQSMNLLIDTSTQLRSVDMGTINKKPFIIRINVGALADMIIEVNAKAKANFGQLAYGFSAIEQFTNGKIAEYTITTAGKTERVRGLTMTIANSANFGFSGVPFIPRVQVDDGYLDIFVLLKSTVKSLAKVIGEAFMNRRKHDQLAHWRIKKATISITPVQSLLRDDIRMQAKSLEIQAVPAAIQIAVPSV